jgi:hypothetical protein
VPAPAPSVIAVPTPPPVNEVTVPAPAPVSAAPDSGTVVAKLTATAPEREPVRHPVGHRPAGLERAGSNAAYLMVKASPHCELHVDQESGERPLGKEFALSPGPHTLHFVNRKLHLDATRTVKLEPGAHLEPRFTFERKPIPVRIAPWAYVTVDGEEYGATPTLNKKLELFEGGHRVELRNPAQPKPAALELKVVDNGENVLRYSFNK